ncbi:Domain of unknown function DUF148 domain-containing protein [Strongyloides ratti]|uniref:DUF148 domain-containing protein n=1 Tax=Strongyloides ratti TaxID=34506 RepID=A0A090LV07_STRRB|nr:Domain of unknown function DUF148 domain-containing protein [Strongyloides ratti]CEF71489.1 Domain of unknown function DUF148 domain-containing protein [Strongyloides ratti]
MYNTFHLILVSFFFIKLISCEDNIKINNNDNQNNLKSTTFEDNISVQIITSTISTTDINIETTIDPVKTLFFLETTYNTSHNFSIDNDDTNLTTYSIPLNDTMINDNEYLNNDIPQFLVLATDEGRKIYYEIQQNLNMKKYNIDKVTRAWAQEQGETINNLYNEYLLKNINEKISHMNYINTIITQLPDEAKDIHKKIEDILDNNNITKFEEEKLITDLLTSVNQTIVKELTKLNYKS